MTRNAAGFAPLALVLLATLGGCATTSIGPSEDLRLRRIVLYQNGIGYFERTGAVTEDRMRLQFREHEVDDVLKSLVVIEEGAGPGKKPATVNVLLPEAKAKTGGDETTWLDLVLSPRPGRPIAIAYAVPMAAWKATYRVVLPDAGAHASEPAAAPGAGRVLLQAWALVDNVTDEDWSDVSLALASGAPLSFASDLRSPRYVARPDANGRMVDPVATGPIMAENSGSVDHDADGILDSDDKCPDDPDGGGEDGCPDVGGQKNAPSRVVVSSSDVRILPKLMFRSGSDALLPEAKPLLDEMAATLRAHPEIKRVAIDGHASPDEKDGDTLSARRAAAVRLALEQRGVATELVPRAFGATRPIDQAANEGGRARNRRAELTIDQGGAEVRLKDLESRVDALKEQTRRARTRDALVRETVLAGKAEQSVRASAAPRDVAGAVRYDIDRPITIPHRSSTLVTLINEYLPGGDVYLFRPEPNAPATATHPLRAARLENRGAHGLEAGSVSVFASGTFAGEGLIERLAPGETAMIPYALDSSTSVRVETKGADEPIRLVALARGVVTVEDAEILTTRYAITAGKQAPSRMFVRHARHGGFEVKALPPGTESTVVAHLVPVALTPGKKAELVIEERRSHRREVAVLDAGGARLGLYLKGDPPAEITGALRDIVTARVDLGKLEEEAGALREQLADTAQRAAEIRASLIAIEKTPRASELQKKLVADLAQTTARGESLSMKLGETSAASSELRARLMDKLREAQLQERPPSRCGAPRRRQLRFDRTAAAPAVPAPTAPDAFRCLIAIPVAWPSLLAARSASACGARAATISSTERPLGSSAERRAISCRSAAARGSSPAAAAAASVSSFDLTSLRTMPATSSSESGRPLRASAVCASPSTSRRTSRATSSFAFTARVMWSLSVSRSIREQ